VFRHFDPGKTAAVTEFDSRPLDVEFAPVPIQQVFAKSDYECARDSLGTPAKGGTPVSLFREELVSDQQPSPGGGS